MNQPVIFSIIESPIHPNFTALYQQLDFQNIQLYSMRKALAEMKKKKPDFIIAEFFYGYGNNYAGVNISNLDVMLRSLQKYAPEAKVIALVEKSERKYVDKLEELFPLHAVLQYPVSPKMLSEHLK